MDAAHREVPGGGDGTVDDHPANSTDILPTIADELQVDVPWKVDGRSLLGEPVPTGRAGSRTGR